MLCQGQRNGDAGAPQFARNCAGCQGADGGGGDKAPAIATMPSVVALSDADLIKIVCDGTQVGMPAFPQFGDAGICAVVDYLRTLQGKTTSNGKPLWHFNLGQVPHASPMSYGIKGKQYFAIAAGSDVFVFGL